MFNLTSEIFTRVKSDDNKSIILNLENNFFTQSDLYYTYSISLLDTETHTIDVTKFTTISNILLKSDGLYDLNYNTLGYQTLPRKYTYEVLESAITSLEVKALEDISLTVLLLGDNS